MDNVGVTGYRVFRALVPGGPHTELTRTTIVRSTFRDSSVPAGATPYYVVRAFDTSANRSVRECAHQKASGNSWLTPPPPCPSALP